ncbi:hypothetical protein DFS34DRAFT_622260 [Phlyctochytrium arcticum]|nr:hypothetical protein DFS34DRAFT_622260 [Phlyctochytrium arcticum]
MGGKVRRLSLEFKSRAKSLMFSRSLRSPNQSKRASRGNAGKLETDKENVSVGSSILDEIGARHPQAMVEEVIHPISKHGEQNVESAEPRSPTLRKRASTGGYSSDEGKILTGQPGAGDADATSNRQPLAKGRNPKTMQRSASVPGAKSDVPRMESNVQDTGAPGSLQGEGSLTMEEMPSQSRQAGKPEIGRGLAADDSNVNQRTRAKTDSPSTSGASNLRDDQAPGRLSNRQKDNKESPTSHVAERVAPDVIKQQRQEGNEMNVGDASLSTSTKENQPGETGLDVGDTRPSASGKMGQSMAHPRGDRHTQVPRQDAGKQPRGAEMVDVSDHAIPLRHEELQELQNSNASIAQYLPKEGDESAGEGTHPQEDMQSANHRRNPTVVHNVGDVIRGGADAAATAGQGVGNLARHGVEQGMKNTRRAMDGAADMTGNVVHSGLAAVETVVGGAADLTGRAVEATISATEAVVGGVVNAASRVLHVGADTTASVASGAAETGAATGQMASDAARTAARGVAQATGTAAETTANASAGIAHAAGTALHSVTDAAGRAVHQVEHAAEASYDTSKYAATSAAKAAERAAWMAVQTAAQSTERAAHATAQTAHDAAEVGRTLGHTAAEKAAEMATLASHEAAEGLKVGKQIGSGMVEGAIHLIETIADSVLETATAAIGAIKGVPVGAAHITYDAAKATIGIGQGALKQAKHPEQHLEGEGVGTHRGSTVDLNPPSEDAEKLPASRPTLPHTDEGNIPTLETDHRKLPKTAKPTHVRFEPGSPHLRSAGVAASAPGEHQQHKREPGAKKETIAQEGHGLAEPPGNPSHLQQYEVPEDSTRQPGRAAGPSGAHDVHPIAMPHQAQRSGKAPSTVPPGDELLHETSFIRQRVDITRGHHPGGLPKMYTLKSRVIHVADESGNVRAVAISEKEE